jgi:hypothetical protein
MKKLEDKISILKEDLESVTDLLLSMKNLLVKDRSDVNKMLEMAKKFDVPDSEIVKLNIGGGHFSTLRSTLVKKIAKTTNIKDEEIEYHEPHLLQL